MVNSEQLQRLATDWSNMAKQPVEVEQVKATYYGFCSELAARRILGEYRFNEHFDIGYSSNRASWYISLSLTPRELL